MDDDYYTDQPLFKRFLDFLDRRRGRWDYVAPDDDGDECADDYLDSDDYDEFADAKWRDYLGYDDEAPKKPQRNAQLPERMNKLLKMIDKDTWQFGMTRSKAFHKQAEFMADYEDDVPLEPCPTMSGPTYADLHVAQLRSYFTVRKQFRLGKVVEAPLTYVAMFVYETLMQIGVKTPEEGYQTLKWIDESYGSSYAELHTLLRRWKRDYVVYYQLQEHYLEEFQAENQLDALYQEMSQLAKADDGHLIDMMKQMPGVDMRKSCTFKTYPHEAQVIVAAALRQVIGALEKHYHHRFITLALGHHQQVRHRMFQWGVFYDPKPHERVKVQVSPRHCYQCKYDSWSVDQYVLYDDSNRFGVVFKAVLHEIDRQARVVLDINRPLKAKPLAAPYVPLIKRVLASALAQEREQQRQREAEERRKAVKIDMSKLGKIRADSRAVQSQLLVEADLQPAQPMSAAPPQPAAPQPVAPQPAAEASGEPQAIHFLRLLVEDGDWQQYLRQIHVPQGVMIENINSQMMDTLGDIVIDDTGDGPELIEDYRPDIEKMIQQYGK